MKRFLILFICIIAILGLGSPYILGFLTEKGLRQTLAQLDKKTSRKDFFAKVDFTEIDIKRGWFSSKVYIKGKIYPRDSNGMILDILASALKNSGSTFTIDSVISHGPFLWNRDPKSQDKLGLATIVSNVILDVRSSSDITEDIPISIKSSISFVGNFSHTLMLPAHKQVVNNRLSFKCLDLDLDFHHSISFSDYSIDLDLDNLQIIHKLFGSAVLKDVNLHKSISRNFENVQISRIFLADEIILSSVTKKELILDDLSQEIVSSVDNKGISKIGITVSLNRLKLQSGEYGPISFETKWDNFEMRLFDEFIQKIHDSEWSLSVKDFFENIGKTVTADSIIVFDPIKFQSERGDLVMQGKITPKFPWPDDLKAVKNIWGLTSKVSFNMSASREITKNIVKYLMVLELRKRLLKTADKSKPKQYLKQRINVKDDAVIKQINKWESSGLLSLDDDTYNLELKFVDGTFNLNGKVL